eukprot:SAG31_NODE_1125_length_9770_cov_2.732499_7_plen_74_part_00
MPLATFRLNKFSFRRTEIRIIPVCAEPYNYDNMSSRCTAVHVLYVSGNKFSMCVLNLDNVLLSYGNSVLPLDL